MICPKKILFKSLKKKLKKKDTIIVFALIIFVSIALSFIARESTILLLPIDLISYFEIQEEASPFFHVLMLSVSALGEFGIAASLTILIACIFAFRRQWLEAIFVVIAAISSTLLSFALKYLIQRPRPFPISEGATGLVQKIDQFSYPSGHVLFFVVFFGFLAYLAWIYLTGFSRIMVISLCTGLIILIGPSRVFLGAHWATDVAGSYLVGAFWLFVLIFAHQGALDLYCNDLKNNKISATEKLSK